MVADLLRPVEATSLKEQVQQQIEELILSGKVQPGARLPAERDLAQQLGVSRPVVHDAILELEKRGLVTLRPRHGCIVNDYRFQGSAELLASLWRHNQGALEPALTEGLLELRVAVEQQAAARLAENPSEETLGDLAEILAESEATDTSDAEAQARLDFRFHFTVVLGSGNLVYAMLMNSFKELYLILLTRFFEDRTIFESVCRNRRELLQALSAGDAHAARRIMARTSNVESYDWHGSWSGEESKQ